MKEHSAVTIWRYINAKRTGHIFHGRVLDIAEETGSGVDWVYRILGWWRDTGAVERVHMGCYRINFDPDLPSRSGLDRSPVNDEDVRKLSESGLSLRQMAVALNTTRGVIAGKRDRLDLPKRPTPRNIQKSLNNQH